MGVKKVFTILRIMLLALLLMGCNKNKYDDFDENNQDLYYVEESGTDLSSEDRYALATNVVVAHFSGEIETYGIYRDLRFEIEEEIKGTITEKEIWVRLVNAAVSDDGKICDCFIDGESYMLALEEKSSVYEAHDFYMTLDSFAMYEPSDECNIMLNQRIINQYKELVESLEDRSGEVETGFEYIRSENLEEIIEKSPYIAVITICEITDVGLNGRSATCKCAVQKKIKGDIDDEFEAIFVEGTVQEGGEYIVMLDRPEDTSYYKLSSKNSVYKNDKSNETINKLLR